MGKLNIAHYKSYHPYRRDNIDKVKREEEEAALVVAKEEGRVLLADSEARIDLLRHRNGLGAAGKKKGKGKDKDKETGGAGRAHQPFPGSRAGAVVVLEIRPGKEGGRGDGERRPPRAVRAGPAAVVRRRAQLLPGAQGKEQGYG
ncbi:hypothetical protein FIBSPDRAFT_851410 [Athelia psychrophila]|uniref:CBF1-interacting co-repressor CIR N-terminal domain-containing protein n=1 Tax=Athelia psychrophila TaxID=1759441 RepID=A0A166SFG8_9AGAM|nr:hypothetical protein FIBSPDRAFT_851410 [Fibularhizoctonia sp. CBS 109695]